MRHSPRGHKPEGVILRDLLGFIGEARQNEYGIEVLSKNEQ
jgi:hypothetical protein